MTKLTAAGRKALQVAASRERGNLCPMRVHNAAHPPSRKEDDMTVTDTNNDAAVKAFIRAKARIDAALEKLTDASDNHFGHEPDEIHYGHVGSIVQIAQKLEQICEFANL